MEQGSFEREMNRACTMGKLGRADYWAGYQRGLRRAHHGPTFGTDEEHRTWLALADDLDESRRERGLGYRDGLFAGGVPSYCTQLETTCEDCSLVNYGRDCRNNPVAVRGETP